MIFRLQLFLSQLWQGNMLATFPQKLVIRFSVIWKLMEKAATASFCGGKSQLWGFSKWPAIRMFQELIVEKMWKLPKRWGVLHIFCCISTCLSFVKTKVPLREGEVVGFLPNYKVLPLSSLCPELELFPTNNIQPTWHYWWQIRISGLVNLFHLVTSRFSRKGGKEPSNLVLDVN